MNGQPSDEEPQAPSGGVIGSLQRRVTAVAQSVLAKPAVRKAQAVIAGADQAGGGLLAAGLAFSALFALLTAVLLLVGVSGWVVADPVRRGEIISQLVAQVPPLASAIKDAIDRVVEERSAISVVGLVGLVWGASNFYGALDGAMARVFPGGRVRGFIETRVRGIVAIVLLVVVALGTVVLGGVWSVVEAQLDLGADFPLPLIRLVTPALTIGVMIAAVFVVYRFVPTAPPRWRAALLPAVVAGTLIGVLTQLYSLLAPRLVGGLKAFGVVAALFGALIWLNYLFQFLLWGGAWARLRRDQHAERQMVRSGVLDPKLLDTPTPAGPVERVGPHEA